MNLIEIFSILIIHWIGDFVLQTDNQAKGKSKNLSILLWHTLNYSYIWCCAGIIFIAYKSNMFTDMNWYKDWSLSLFVLITFICHTITDYFTSRLNAYLWDKKDVRGFFVSIGFDQMLHYIQLFTTYYYLKTIL
jgi:hypothetical protein